MTGIVFVAALVSSAHAAPLSFRSGPARTHLIELYSSEGCSSCPPADDWLNSLAKRPELWKDFVPVAFHVTYWDYLGWRDRFGDASFDARQREQAASWGARSTYTPGLALDGEEYRSWGAEPPKAEGVAGILAASISSGTLSARYTPPADAGPFYLYAARLGFATSSQVTAGENSGRLLRHDFVVRGLSHSTLSKGKDGSWTTRLPLPASAGPSAQREGLAVWVVGRDGRPVQAAGAYLP